MYSLVYMDVLYPFICIPTLLAFIVLNKECSYPSVVSLHLNLLRM